MTALAMPTRPRLIDQAGTRARLFEAVAAMPAGVKLSIPALRDALVSQADVLAGLQSLIAEGLLDLATLRPVASASVEASPDRPPTGAELADRLAEHCTMYGLSLGRALRHLRIASCAQLRQHQPRQTTIARFTAFFDAPPPPELAARRAGAPRVAAIGGVTGAELAARLEALIAEHGLSRTRVGLKVYGNRDGVSVLRHSNPRRATVARILALLADPPIEDLKPRDAWAGRRRKRELAVVETGGCAPPVIVRRKADQTSLTFEEQLGRVERGEVGIGPNFKVGRPDPSGTLGGVTGEINL